MQIHSSVNEIKSCIELQCTASSNNFLIIDSSFLFMNTKGLSKGYNKLDRYFESNDMVSFCISKKSFANVSSFYRKILILKYGFSEICLS